jgi:NAD+ kinase
MDIAIYGRNFNPDFYPNVQWMFDSLAKHGCRLQVYRDFYAFLEPEIRFTGEVEVFSHHYELRSTTRFLLSVGGDGTLLDTITLVRDSGIPVAGINLGRLGFLSSTSRHEITNAVEELIDGKFDLDPRSLLRLESCAGYFGELNYALNEASVYKNVPNSMITIQAWVDGMFMNSFWADGLILATPTGSTAYSLSCGGPIIAPACSSFVVTPIASHNLTVRPIVVPDSSEIRLKVDAGGKEYSLSLDSRVEVLKEGIELTFRKAAFQFNLVRLHKQHFFRAIRDKLAWGLDARN